MELPLLELSGDFQAALDAMENTSDCLFITGKAGTGKSTLLGLFKKTTRKRVVILAPTGIAALNVGGQTIHSFFGFPPRMMEPSEITKRKYSKIFEKLDAVVLDEVSMLRVDMIDCIDRFLRINRNRMSEPFGGVQMIMFGDLFQLPPVVNSKEEGLILTQRYESPYFFSGNVFKEIEITMIELRQVYRQSDRHFLRILEAIRHNECDEDTLEDLNIRHKADFDDEEDDLGIITLSARNQTVDELNLRRLEALTTKEYTYYATVSGDFNPNLQPAPSQLKLRLGAQVMFVRNDPERKYVNGSIGRIVALGDENIEVMLRDMQGKVEMIEVPIVAWENTRYTTDYDGNPKQEVTGSYKQYPLRLAWAITIHKSQGQTFDRCIIDLGKAGAFEHGQTYVALSRCRTLEGIILKQKLMPKDIMTDPRVVEFFESHL